MKVVFQGLDSWSRPVYLDPDTNTLWKDVDPRKDCEPNLCTSVNGSFDGEPCDNMKYMEKYKDVELEFEPERVTWD